MKDSTKPLTDQTAGQRRRGALSCAECRRSGNCFDPNPLSPTPHLTCFVNLKPMLPSRLKLRCDRVFPCSSCTRFSIFATSFCNPHCAFWDLWQWITHSLGKKRGCAAICPDGALTTGKGNRQALIFPRTIPIYPLLASLAHK